MLQFDIDASDVLRVTGSLVEKLADFKKPLTDSSLFMERQTKQRIIKQQDPDGKAYAPLRPSTLRRKKTNAILIESGRLVSGIQAKPPSGNEVAVEDTSNYGIWHQRGTRKMAQRAFLGFANEDIEGVRSIFGDYLSE